MKTSSKIALIAAGIVAVLFARQKGVSGIGAAERIKRRIYKEVSLAQDAGVDFSRKFDELTGEMKDALTRIGHDVGWKQSKRSAESGKSYNESYYGSLRRAWNAVSGVRGIGAAYNVKDANGNIVLTWIEDAAHHVYAEREAEESRKRVEELEQKLRKQRNTIRRRTTRPETIPAEIKPIEPIAPKLTKTEQKAVEKKERNEFAENYINIYLQQHPDEVDFWTQMLNEKDGSRADIITKEFVNGDLKIKEKLDSLGKREYKIYLQGRWRESYEISNKKVWALAFGLIYEWEHADERANFANEEYLNDARKDLLAKAQHMQVVITERDQNETVYNMFQRETVQGQQRYDYLPFINWIVVLSQRYSQAGDVYYPVRSYPDKESAMAFADYYGRAHGGTVSVKPVWDVPIKKITGIGVLSTRNLLEPGLMEYVRVNIDENDVQDAMDEIGQNREPLYRANGDLYNEIVDLVEEWCTDNAINPDTIWSVVDVEDIFWTL